MQEPDSVAVHSGAQHKRGAQVRDVGPPRGGDDLQLERQHHHHHPARGPHDLLQDSQTPIRVNVVYMCTDVQVYSVQCTGQSDTGQS